MEKKYKWDIPKLKKLAQRVNEIDQSNTYIDEGKLSYILYNLRFAYKHEFEGTNIQPYHKDVEKYENELKDFIRQALEKQQEQLNHDYEVLVYTTIDTKNAELEKQKKYYEEELKFKKFEDEQTEDLLDNYLKLKKRLEKQRAEFVKELENLESFISFKLGQGDYNERIDDIREEVMERINKYK